MKKNKCYLFSFLIVFLVLTLVLIITGSTPFGNNSIVVSDFRDQYITFINYFKTIFYGNNNFLYTFSGTLGTNMLNLSAYYLISIFNLTTIFVSSKYMYTFLTLIVLVKLSLSSTTFMYYLNKKNGFKKINYLFAISYGLMSYNMAFYFHIMWLDAIILLPLVILGIEKIFKNEGSSLYIFALGLTIMSNYYIGVIVCLFSVIYFIYYYISNYNRFDKIKVIKKYIIGSLLGGMLSFIIILPVFFALVTSKAVVSDTNVIVPTIYNSLEILGKLINSPFAANQIWHGGPNIFAGTLMTILFVYSFFNKKISKRQKIINFVTILFLFLTFRIHLLDLMFHGLNEPNCFDFRHAFIFTFMMLIISYQCLENFDFDAKFNKIYLIIFILFLFLATSFNYFEGIRSLFLIYSLFITIIIFKNLKKFDFKKIFILVIIDLTINAVNTMGTTIFLESKNSNVLKNQNYITTNENVLKKLNDYDDSFYRLEHDYHFGNSINDSMMFGYNGISHFDSTSNIRVEQFLEKLGFRRLLSRIYYGSGSTKLVDSLLGIKYILSYNDQFKDYEKLIDDEINVYKNPYYIGFAYKIKSLNDLEFNENIFENLNKIVKNNTNVLDDIYTKVNYETVFNNVSKQDNKYVKDSDSGDITYIIDVTSTDNIYMYFPDNLLREGFKTARIFVNDQEIGTYFDKYNYGVIDLGSYEIGEKISVKMEFLKDCLIFDNVYIYYENNDLLKQAINDLKINNEVEKISSSNLKINVDLEEESLILLTIPYEEGFEVKVNGELVQSEVVYNSLIAIKVPKGSSTIQIDYCPKGLTSGALVSGFALVTTIIYLYVEKRKLKQYEKISE